MREHKWNDARHIGIDIGDKIYYKGDMANISGWGAVTKVDPCDHYVQTITLELEDGRVQKVNPYMLGAQIYGSEPIYGQGGLKKHVVAYKKQWEKVNGKT